MHQVSRQFVSYSRMAFQRVIVLSGQVAQDFNQAFTVTIAGKTNWRHYHEF
jgi:hypothetical protein